jgi:hypothetical protein
MKFVWQSAFKKQAFNNTTGKVLAVMFSNSCADGSFHARVSHKTAAKK